MADTVSNETANDPLMFDHACETVEPAGISDYSGENVIEWIRGQKIVTAQLAGHSKLCNKIRKYAEEFPDEVRIVGENADGSIVAHIPLKYVKLTKPPKREFTEEQREAAAKRLAKARSSRSGRQRRSSKADS